MKQNKQRRLAAVCMIAALSATLLISGCSNGATPTTEGQKTPQTGSGQVDPALTPQTGEDADSKGEEPVDKLASVKSEAAMASTTEEKDGKSVVTNPESIYVVVNKQRSLPDGYEPADLVEPNVKFSFSEAHEKRHMRKEAAAALEQLFASANESDIELNAVSGYRSYKRQQSLFSHYVDTQGQEYASRVSAVPGTSEHQTGLSIDVSSPSVSNELEQVFGASKEGKWLAEHAHEAGFIIRYPEDGEAITGYMYEPWHIRYVGVDTATAIYEQKTTLEQFLSD
ncbi:M15 family metallopeptidase [Paenibacillus sp. ACRRX]|uniref:M15 family metallopeptidase n=1 Tax=unclassified Paenibacillus TaxID=185978 RepID=UPI001EF7522C|nr:MULTISPECIES: M15 family metallopeptidase [unclassified Paenibacillus]MCG7408632.1 M15 family metallopeptidase [Paenibacillus sp. ACRRX]MDK8182877.1 M15 family metallopeptidase [Paenibacillus sp. UMB4589-SE434]